MISAFIITLLVALSSSFIGAWLFQFAYEAIAWEFNLPTFGYWVYFAVLIVLKMIFKPTSVNNNNSN